MTSLNKHILYPSKNKSGDTAAFSAKLTSPYRTSHNSLKHSYKHNNNTEQRHVKKPVSQVKKVKHAYGRRRIGMQYTLQSKDSLLDVTACLQGKRNEVMKLWQKHIPKGDPNLLSKIEGANHLALEAAQEVEKLRTTIQELQRKEDGLSDSDCVKLEEMRVNVLEKVKQFEVADNLLQEIISQSESKEFVVDATSKTSQTESNNTARTYTVKKSESTVSVPQLPSHSHSQQHAPIFAKKSHSSHDAVVVTSDFIILKEKADLFSEESECDNDIINKNSVGIYEDGAIRELLALHPGNKTVGDSAITSLDHLNRLKELCKRNQDCLPVEEMIELTQKSENVKYKPDNADKKRQIHQHHPKKKTERADEKIEREHWDNFSAPENNDDFYREKISTLRRQLMDTEHEVEELKSEIERIESDANFRVQMLQNSIRDNFESLRIIPDYLQMVDQKLNETLQHKSNLQQAIANKDIIINELKNENHNLAAESEKIREQLRKAENGKDFLSFRNSELEKSNTDLRKQVEDLTKQVAEMTCQLQVQKVESKSSRPSRHELWETHKLKLQCADLKDQLTQSKKIIQTLRKSKTKMVCSLNQRVEELMDALQKSQDQKRILGDQVHNYKKSYNQIFSTDLGTQHQQQRKKKCSRERHHKTSNTVKSQLVEVEEPKIQPTVTWQTGFRIKLDDLLRAPSSVTKLARPCASVEDFSNIKFCFK